MSRIKSHADGWSMLTGVVLAALLVVLVAQVWPSAIRATSRTLAGTEEATPAPSTPRAPVVEEAATQPIPEGCLAAVRDWGYATGYIAGSTDYGIAMLDATERIRLGLTRAEHQAELDAEYVAAQAFYAPLRDSVDLAADVVQIECGEASIQ